MKKLLAVLLIMSLSVSMLVGCGSSDKDTNKGNDSNVSQNTENKNTENQNTQNQETEKEDNSDSTETGLKTCKFSTYIQGEYGVITYNSETIELIDTGINGAKFDMSITEGKRTDIIGVTLSVESDEDVKAYFEYRKSGTESRAVTSKFSEIKEALINDIPVQYFSCVYSMDGEKELSYLDCFIDFPNIDYGEYAIVLRVENCKLGEELILKGLENLLVDVELRGVKPVGNNGEGSTVENDKVDLNKIYATGQVFTATGKMVSLYSDPQIVQYWENDVDDASLIYAQDMNNVTYGIFIYDAISAEDYIALFLQNNNHLEIRDLEEIQVGGRAVHAFHFKEIETGRDYGSLGVMELSSDVVIVFHYKHVRFGEPGFEELIKATQITVE